MLTLTNDKYNIKYCYCKFRYKTNVIIKKIDKNIGLIKKEPLDEEEIKTEILEESIPRDPQLLSCVKTEVDESPSTETIPITSTESNPIIPTESTPVICKQEPLDGFSDAGHHFMSDLITQTVANNTENDCNIDTKPVDGFDLPGPGQCYAAPLDSNYYNPSLYITNSVHKHTCEVCLQSFKYKKMKENHILIHHKDRFHDLKESITNKVFTCTTCGYQTVYESILNNHVKKHEAPAKKVRKQKIKYKKKFYCILCGKSFIGRVSLDNHLIRKHNNYELVVSEVLYCYYCSYHTLSESTLRKHLETHTKNPNAEKYCCGTCNFTTCNQAVLTRHKREVHGGDERLICSFCKKKFNNKMALDTHLLATHKYETKNIAAYMTCPILYCDICPYTCLNKISLNNHAICHKDSLSMEKYSCEVCMFETLSKKQISIHKREGYCKSFPKCSDCSYRTPFECKMLEHKNKHEKDLDSLQGGVDNSALQLSEKGS